MKKAINVLAMVMALVFIGVAFAPAALAVSYAPYNWSLWPTQSRNCHSTMYTKAIQRYLNSSMNAGLSTDGVFGTQTHNYVCGFQGACGLTVDGIVGSGTWTKMRACMKAYAHSGGTGNVYKVGKLSGGYETYFSFVYIANWQVNVNPSSSSTAKWETIKA